MDQSEAVARAVKQLVASAIKHSAQEVSFSLTGEKTVLRFLLGDSRASELELPVPPSQLAGVLVERVRFYVAVAPSKVKSGLLRTEFTSMVSDCEAKFYLHGPKNSLSRVVLSNFNVDAPDRAGFWLGFDHSILRQLKRLLNDETGVYFVWSESAQARSEALLALKSAYPKSESIPIIDALSDDLPFLEKGKNTKIFVGVSGRDPLGLLQTLQLFRPEKREVIKAAIFQSEVEQNCISCRECIGAPHSKELKALGEEKGGIEVLKGKGCAICEGKGHAGTFSVSSIIGFEGKLRELFLDDAPFSMLMKTLKAEQFYLPYEFGLRALRLGECSEEAVINGLTRPPQGYELRIPTGEVCLVETAKPAEERQSESGRFILSDEFFASDKEKAAKEEEPYRAGPSVYIPRSEPYVPKVEISALPKKVLVIDDDPDQRAILGKVFEMAGYVVSSAADGIDGIVSAAQETPQLILVDLMMPDVDGRETIRRLRQNPSTKDVPIVALTAYPDPEVEFDLLDAGANDFCAKSVSKKVLLKRVEKLVTPG
jgi:CheY-like chemotaxis protein